MKNGFTPLRAAVGTGLFCILLAVVGFGCRKAELVPYDALLSSLTNYNAIAELDVPRTELICSYDRTGANEDYNHFQGKTADGDLILADLRGPGVVSRFWFTGIPADATISFRFDGEKTPRLAFSWDELRAVFAPFDCPPIAIDEQNCWYSYLPIPFEKRLLITVADRGYKYGGSPKVYYQLNWQPLPRGRRVDSLTLPLSPSNRQLLSRVADAWLRMDFGTLPEAGVTMNVPAAETVDVWTGEGPATLQTLTLKPDFSSIPSAWQRDQILRNVLLQIYWDGQAEPSVNVPLGDFFGSVWQRWRAESMYVGSKKDAFFCRFPMPFDKHCRIALVNPTSHAFQVAVGADVGALRVGGCFHAAWHNSPASATGKPHTVLAVEGKGRYAGCVLSVVSADRSFWVLESDESMVVDGDLVWHGTGLEDYFNSGWYYGNVFARPLHGLPNKAPFRTVQYRFHMPDPVVFDDAFKMRFERGPDQKSHAAYESVAYYYLEHPQAAGSTVEMRTAPADAVQPYTLMTDLWNFERFDDLAGQVDYIDRYLEQYKPPFPETLRMRKSTCQFENGNLSKDAYLAEIRPFTDSTNQLVRQQQAVLTQLYTDPNAILVQFYANMQSELYLDGERILVSGDPKTPTFITRRLSPGKHVLAAASAAHQYPLWTQVAVRDANGYIVGTDGEWKHAINPTGEWLGLDYDDSGWSGFDGYSARVKGPPEEPYVWVHPDPFIKTLSQANGLRPSVKWPDKQGRVVYRKIFEIE